MTTARLDVPGLPETVPARMVNEFVYCARLFYLEWVQGRFASSDDVEEGLYVHRVVDQPSGDLPDADPEREELAAGRRIRSLWITSEDLGVSAKVDLVEVGADGAVVPVDYKKGHPDKRGRLWPSDVVQSALQAMLLRERGHRVDRAEIWYAEAHQRLVIPVDDDLVGRTRDVLRTLWSVAAGDSAPARLVDSPKCPRCSLVGICLPDETNTLRVRAAMRATPRRILPKDPDHRPVYVQEQGAVVGVRRGRLEIFKDGEVLASYRLIDASQVNLQGNITVTPQAMRELFARETAVSWFSYGGWFAGTAHGLPNKHVDLRRAQATLNPEASLDIARRMVESKIRNSRTLLRRNSRGDVTDTVAQLGALAAQAGDVPGAPTLLGVASRLPGHYGRAPLRYQRRRWPPRLPVVFRAITAGLHCGAEVCAVDAAAVAVFPAITAGLHCGMERSIRLARRVESSRPSRPGSIAVTRWSAPTTALSWSSRPSRPGSIAVATRSYRRP